MDKNKASIKREAEVIVNKYFPKKKKISVEIDKDNVASEIECLVEETPFTEKEVNANSVNGDSEIVLLNS